MLQEELRKNLQQFSHTAILFSPRNRKKCCTCLLCLFSINTRYHYIWRAKFLGLHLKVFQRFYSKDRSQWFNIKTYEEGMATHSGILAWRVPVDRGACKESAMTERLSTERTVQETELLLSDRKHALQKASSTWVQTRTGALTLVSTNLIQK